MATNCLRAAELLSDDSNFRAGLIPLLGPALAHLLASGALPAGGRRGRAGPRAPLACCTPACAHAMAQVPCAAAASRTAHLPQLHSVMTLLRTHPLTHPPAVQTQRASARGGARARRRWPTARATRYTSPP